MLAIYHYILMMPNDKRIKDLSLCLRKNVELQGRTLLERFSTCKYNQSLFIDLNFIFRCHCVKCFWFVCLFQQLLFTSLGYISIE